MLGNGRLEAYCFDNVSRLCHIRGKLRKRVWIQQGDIVLVGLREFQDAKADVILKYDNEEARSLKAYGELPENGARARARRAACRGAAQRAREPVAEHAARALFSARAQCKSTWTSAWTATSSRTTPLTLRRSESADESAESASAAESAAAAKWRHAFASCARALGLTGD